MTKNKKIDDLNTFENLLKEYYEQKNLEMRHDFSDVRYSFKERQKINDNMKLALKHLKVKRMPGKMNLNNMTFSQVIYSYRSRKKLSQQDMKKILGIRIELLDDLESGKKRIDSLDERTIAGILSKLKITLSQYAQLLINEIKAKSVKSNSIQAFARSKSTMSSDDRSKKMQHGIDAVMLEISKRKNDRHEVEIDEKHIENVRKYLEKLGETKLLK